MTQPSDPTPTISPCPSCGRSLPAGTKCPECEETRTGSATPETRSTHAGPKQIAGYRIIRELGAGGMGTVFEAYEEKMGRRVALKVLSRHIASSEKAEQRFSREAWIAGRLTHPNLVKVFERGTWEEFSFYSMELVRGGSLGDVIKNMKQWGRDENVGCEFGSREYVHWVLTHMITVARGLDYAHREGVVHRDIKPMNLLLSRKLDTVKIADFGLAIDLDTTRLTTEGKVLGTLVYMAPEQILGKQGQIDARTDVFALGATLFELLTLERPYSGKTHQLYMNSVLTGEARRPRRLNDRVSRDLEIVIRKALEKDRKDRYRTAALFADDLDNVLHFRPIAARPPGLPEKIFKWARRKPIHAALACALTVGIPTVTVLGLRASQQRNLLAQMRIQEWESEAKLFWQKGQYQEVVERTSEILQFDPNNIKALFNRSIAFTYMFESASDPAAAEHWEKRSLHDTSRVVELTPDAAWPHLNRAWILEKLGREEEAERAEAVARQYRPEEPTVEDLYFDALRALNEGEYERVVPITSELLARRPDRRDVRAMRGDAYEELGELDKAINDYLLVAALEPDQWLNYWVLGRLHAKAGSFEEGLSYLRQAVQRAPENAFVHETLSRINFEMGQVAASEGRIDDARRHFGKGASAGRTSIAIDAKLPHAHNNLGANLSNLSRLEEEPDRELLAEAVEHFAVARSLVMTSNNTDDVQAFRSALVNECDVLIQLRDFPAALDRCEIVVAEYPENPNGYYNLAGIYALMGNTDEAFQALEQDFELGDHDFLYLKSDPWFDSLREDPRFRDLIERMKRAAG